MKRLASLFFIFILMPLRLHAQAEQNIGIQADQSYSRTDIDSVNLLTGNVTHQIPILSYPQKGNLPPLTFSFDYNSNPWYRQATCDSYSEECVVYYTNQGPQVSGVSGFLNVPLGDSYAVTLPAISNYLLRHDFGVDCASPDPELEVECNLAYFRNVGVSVDEYSRSITVLDDTGAQHPLYFDANNPNWARAADGSGYALNSPNVYNAYSSFGSSGPLPATFYDKAGNHVNYLLNNYSYQAPPYPLLTDVYGNNVTLTLDPLPGTAYYTYGVVDSIGRHFNAPSGPASSSSCPAIGNGLQPALGGDKWSVPGPNGGSQDYIICYTAFMVHPGFFDGQDTPSTVHCDDYYYNYWNIDAPDTQFQAADGGEPFGSPIACDAEYQIVAIQAIVLPNGSYWGFTYDAGQTSTCDNYDGHCTTPSYGAIQSVTLPTGATISYQYQNITQTWASAYIMNYRVLTQRTVVDATNTSRSTYYKYITPYVPGGTDTRTIETDAIGNDTVHVFGGVGGSAPAAEAYLNDPYYVLRNSLESETDHYQGSSINSSPMLLAKDVTTFSGQNTTVRPLSIAHYEGPLLTAVKSFTYPSTYAYQYYVCEQPYFSSCNPMFPTTILRDTPTQIIQASGDGTVISQTVSSPLDLVQPAYAAANILNKVASNSIFDGSGSLVGETDYRYDENTAASAVVLGSNTSISRLLFGASPVVSHTSYNADGTILDVTDPTGTHTHINSYQCNGLYPASVTSAYGSTNSLPESTVSTIDCNTGRVLSTTDPNGIVAIYDYQDSLGRPTRVRTAVGTAQESWTRYNYPTMNQVNVTRDLGTKGDGMLASQYISDGIGHVIHSIFPGGIKQDFHYNADGQLDTRSNLYSSIADPTYGITSFTYDGTGRKTRQTLADGSFQQWCYSGSRSSGQTNCRANASSYVGGSWVDSSDEVGNVTQSVTDGGGRLVRVVEPGGMETRYGYDALGNLLNIDQMGLTTETPRARTFTYDSLSRLAQSYNPETGWICYGTTPSNAPANGSNCIESYDGNGNLLAKTDARGVAMSYQYDALNRIMMQRSADGALVWDYGYDNTAFSPGGIGKLFWESNGSSASSFYYDSMGRVTTESFVRPSMNNVWGQVNAAYDLAGNMTDLTYPDGRHIQQTWDGAGHLGNISLADVNGVSPSTPYKYLNAGSYYPDGSVNTSSYGNDVQEIIGKNNRLQTQTIIAGTVNGPAFLSRTYCYIGCLTGGNANNGSIWGIADGLNPARTQGFTYDSLNRISSFSLGGTLNQQYAIDSFGELSGLVNGVPATTFDSATNRISNLPCASSTVAYDAAGNQLCDSDQYGGVRQYSYDAMSHITQIAALGYSASPFENYSYDGNGDRIRKSGANGDFTEYVNFGGKPIAEKHTDGTWSDDIFANGQRIARATQTGQVLKISGTNSPGGYTWFAITGNAGLTGYAVQPGDRLYFRQRGHGTAGGGVAFDTDQAASGSWTTTGPAFDQDGIPAWHDTSPPEQWHRRIIDVSFEAGNHLQTIYVGNCCGTSGDWSIDYADFTLVSANGDVHPIYTGMGTIGLTWWGANASNIQYATAPIPDDAPHYYVSDHLGSAAEEFASGGWPVWREDYYPFGQEINPQPTPNSYKFTGKERDQESGLDYFGARYYASNMGRFMSPDWAAKAMPVPYAKLDNPQSLNLYSYVGNNPLSRMDPDGHYECSGTKDQCAGLKAALAVVKAADGNLKAGTTGKATLDKVLSFYGDEGKKNGVAVNFSNTDKGAYGATSTKDGVTTISFNAKTLEQTGNTGRGETVAHEGTHGVDQQKSGMASSFWGIYATEYHAYQAESAVDKGLGVRSETDNPPVWAPGISPGQRTQTITRDAYSNAQYDCKDGGCQP